MMVAPGMTLKALALNCSLKSAKGGEASSTQKLLVELAEQLGKLAVDTEIIRAVDCDISRGPPMTWAMATDGRRCVPSLWRVTF
jgi:hypothetical protein